MAVMTSQLPLEMQLLLGRGLAVGLSICWQQPACAGGAVAEVGGSPHIPRPPVLYLHCPCSLPTASGPCAPLPIVPDPQRSAGGGGRGPLVKGAGVLPRPARALSVGCAIRKHWCCRTDKQTGVLQERLSLSVGSGPAAPMGPPAAPGWGRGKGRGGSCLHPCPVRQHLAPGRAQWLIPCLRCTCTRCTGAEGNRFPSVSCAAAEP